MDKTIFALAGRSGCGKSKTVNFIYDLLEKEFEITDKNLERRYEIEGTFKINGIIFGIASMGDPCTDLRGRLLALKKQRCQIIICATRTNGETIDAVIELRPSYQTCWDRQKYVDGESAQINNNKKMAQSFVNKIQCLMEHNTPAS